MPLINKYKIYNFKYGTSTDRLMSHQTLELEGDHLQIEASNTVGKSMSIQTLIQAICPLSNVAKTFAEVYTKKEPVCVLIEWILDDFKSKILTGIVFEKKQHTFDTHAKNRLDQMYRSVQFVIEVSPFTGIEIDSFPYLFIDENGNKTARTTIETEEVLKNLQKKLGRDKVSFYSGNSNGRSNYRKKLAEYGISQEEWKEIIIKMNNNNKEGGLSEFLKVYKTSENLMGNKIIPLIDTSLITETDDGFKPSINVLKNQVYDFLEVAIEMRDRLTDHKNFILLKEFVSETQQKLDDVLKIDEQVKELEEYLSLIYACLENEISKLANEKKGFEREHELKVAETQQIKYEEDSYSYHQEINKIKTLNAKKDVHEEELAIKKTELTLVEEKINTLAYRNKYNAVRREESDKARKEAEREKETKAHEEIVKKLKLYGGTVHQILLNNIEQLKGDCQTKQLAIAEKQKELEGTKEYIGKLVEKESNIKAKKISHNQRINEYENKLEKFIKKEELSQKFASRGIFGTIIDFEGFEKIVSQEIKNSETQELLNKQTIKENDAKINNNSDSIKYLLDQKTPLNFEKSQLEERQQKLMKLKREFNVIKEEYGLNANIGNVSEVSQVLEHKMTELENDNIKQLRLKGELQEEVENLKNVKAIHIDEELVAELERMGIHVVEGAGYLASLNVDDSFREKLIHENNLLPFSLIVEEDEYKKLIKNGIFSKLTSIVPVFKKNELSLKGAQLADGVTEFNGMTVINSFDVNILNPELRTLKIEELEQRIRKIGTQLEDLIIERKRLSRFYEQYQAFEYTELDGQLEIEIAKCEQELRSIESKISKQQQEVQILKENNEKLVKLNEQEVRKIISLNQLLKEISELTEFSKEIELKRKDLSHINKEEQDTARQKEYLGQKVKQLESEVDGLKDILFKTRNDLENIENKDILKFKMYAAGIFVPNKTLDELIGSFDGYMTSSNSRRIGELNEEIQRIDARLTEYRKEKEEIFGLLSKTEEEILNTPIIETENGLKENRNILGKEITSIDKEINSLAKEIYSNEKIAEKIKNDIVKEYKKADVIPIEEINNFNFADRLKENKKEIKDIADVIKDVELKSSNLSDELRALTPYKKEGKESVQVIQNPIDESFKTQQALSKLLGEKDSFVEKYNKTIYDLRLFKVKYEKKYDNYINGLEMYSENYQKQKIQLETVLMVIMQEIEKIESHTQTLEKQKAIVSRMTREHVENCINQLKNINKLGKHKGQQLFNIQLPNQNEIEHSLSKINTLIDEIMNSGELKDVNDKINSFYLLNHTIALSSLPIKTLKYELNRGDSKGETIKWNEIEGKTSGAQKFCIAFVVNVVLMEYKRYSRNYTSTDNSIKGKVLLMDNPFGETTEQQFLDELFDLAEKFKVQIISYTHIKNDSVRNHFNRIYTMTAEKTPSGKEIAEFTPVKGVKEKINEVVNLGSYRIEEKNKYHTQDSLFDIESVAE